MPRRSNIIRKLRKCRSELTPILVAAAVDVEKVDTIFINLETKEIPEIETYIDRLAEFKGSDAYRSFMDVWTARGPEWWANMRVLGEVNLRPFKLLRAASKPLRAEWRKTNGRQAAKENGTESDNVGRDLEGSGLQSEGGRPAEDNQ